jgi:methionyl aminopeptidase
MIQIKTASEIDIMRNSCLLVGKAHATIAKILKAGITTAQVNAMVEEFIRDNGGVPSFLGYHGFKFATCISVNNAVVHGFPSDTPLKDGDVFSLDVGILKNGFHGDSAYSYAIGEVSDDVKKLLRITKESLYAGTAKARVGNRIGDIAYAIQEHTEIKNGFGVVRELVGHGVGKSLHEDPQVPNYGKRGTKEKLKAGMVLAIEPMINMGKKDVTQLDDGWTILTRDGLPSAHFEHNVHVTQQGPDLLTSFEEIEAAEKANSNLTWSY